MELLIIILAVCAIAVFFSKRSKKRLPGFVYGKDHPPTVETPPVQKQNKQQLPYRMREALFTEAERSFYGVLSQVIADKAIVFGKVRIADVIEPAKGLSKSHWQTAFNQVSRKHFDYVLCRPDDLSVMAVIELDDKSHTAPKQLHRDQLVETACASAGLIIHRFRASHNYSIHQIRNKIFPSDTVINSETVASESEKKCPKCSSLLITKKALKGVHKGKEFLACSSFPRCRYTA